MDAEATVLQNDGLRGGVALLGDPGTRGFSALREYAPLADPIVCSNEAELFQMLERETSHWHSCR